MKIRNSPLPRLWIYRLSTIVLLVLMILLVWSIRPILMVNVWSVSYTQQALNNQSVPGALGIPSTYHPRGFLWLARDALAMGQPNRAIELLNEIPSGRSLERLRIRGLALEVQGRFSESIQVWAETRNVILLKSASARATKDGRPSDAVALMRVSYKIDPIKETLNLANSLWNTAKDHEGAIELLRSSIAAYPSSRLRVRWMLQLGDFLRVNQEWDEATSIYHDVIEEYPDNANSWIGLGWVMYNRNAEMDATRAVFETAIELAPDSGVGYLAVGQLLAQEGLHTEADNWFERAIDIESNNPWWLVDRANNARDGNDLNLAFHLYDEIISRFPEFARAYYEIAYAYQLNEQPAQAAIAVERALALMESPNVYYYLRAGGIYEEAGDGSRALDTYRQALLIDPRNAAARQGVERLDK